VWVGADNEKFPTAIPRPIVSVCPQSLQEAPGARSVPSAREAFRWLGPLGWAAGPSRRHSCGIGKTTVRETDANCGASSPSSERRDFAPLFAAPQFHCFMAPRGLHASKSPGNNARCYAGLPCGSHASLPKDCRVFHFPGERVEQQPSQHLQAKAHPRPHAPVVSCVVSQPPHPYRTHSPY
jgi:hypothetical protein